MNCKQRKINVLLVGVFLLAAGLPGREWSKMWDCGPLVYFIDNKNPST